MAHKRLVELVDDLDGQPADETVEFGLDGVDYVIDLSSENAEALRRALKPFTAKARKSRRPAAAGAAGAAAKPAPQPRTTEDPDRAAAIRAWAQKYNIAVNDRGRIPAAVIEAYETHDPSKAKQSQRTIPELTFRSGF